MAAKFQVTDQLVQSFLVQYYGIEVDEIVKFEGYDDFNFGVTNTATGKKFAVKISDPRFIKDIKVVEEIDRFVTHVSDQGFQVPVPIKPQNRIETYIKVTFGDEESIMRVMKFLNGKTMKSVEITDALLLNAAEYAAKFHLAVKDFKSDILPKRDYIWLLRNAALTRNYLTAVKDESKRQLASKVLDEFEEKVLKNLNEFPQSMIHGDLNEANIFVTKKECSNSYETSGLVDFSDIDYAPRVFDISTLIIYMVLETNNLSCVNKMIKSYCSIVKLSEIEMSIIELCMKGRLVQSLILGAYSYENDPTNEYVLKTSINGWKILSELSKL